MTHGKNMSPFDEVTYLIDELYDEAKNWADGDAIVSAEQHDKVTELRKAIHDAGAKAETMRVDEKKPFDEAVKVIQDKYNPYIQGKKGKVDVAKDALGKILEAWRVKELRAKEEKASAEKAEADRLKAEAEEAIRASAGNIEERENAEKLLEQAKKQEKTALNTQKTVASGNGLRKVYIANLVNLNDAIKHYWASDRDEFIKLVETLAKRDVLSGQRSIAGFEIVEEKRAI